MICAERERLIESYRASVEAYADAVRGLKNLSREEFPEKYSIADEARERCDRLRELVAKHRSTHGC